MSLRPKLKSTSSRSVREYYLPDNNKETKDTKRSALPPRATRADEGQRKDSNGGSFAREDGSRGSSISSWTDEGGSSPSASPQPKKREAAPAAKTSTIENGGGGGGERVSEGRAAMATGGVAKMRSISSRSLRTWALGGGSSPAADESGGGGEPLPEQSAPVPTHSSSSGRTKEESNGSSGGSTASNRLKMLASSTSPSQNSPSSSSKEDSSSKKQRSTSSRSLKQYMMEKASPSADLSGGDDKKRGTLRGVKPPTADEIEAESRSVRSKTFKFFKEKDKTKDLDEEEDDKQRLKKTPSWGRKEAEKVKTVLKSGTGTLRRNKKGDEESSDKDRKKTLGVASATNKEQRMSVDMSGPRDPGSGGGSRLPKDPPSHGSIISKTPSSRDMPKDPLSAGSSIAKTPSSRDIPRDPPSYGNSSSSSKTSSGSRDIPKDPPSYGSSKMLGSAPEESPRRAKFADAEDDGKRRSVSLKPHPTRTTVTSRMEARMPSFTSEPSGPTSPRGRGSSNPAVPQAVLSAVAALGASQAGMDAEKRRSKLITPSPDSSSSSSSLSSSPSSSSSSWLGPSPGSASGGGNSRGSGGTTDPPLRSPRGHTAHADSEGSSPSPSPRTGSSKESPLSSPRDRSATSPRGVLLSSASISRSSSAPATPLATGATSPRRQSRMRASSKRADSPGHHKRKKKKGGSFMQREGIDERRKQKEKDIMGEGACALTKTINMGVVSLLANVHELDYGEVMKLRTSVREWTTEVDRVMERMRKEFYVTPVKI